MTFNGVVGGLEPVSTYQYLRLPICVLLMWCSSTDQNCVSTGERDFWVVGGLEQISLCLCLFVCVLLMLCNPINPDPKSSGERNLGPVRGLKSVSTCLRFPTCVLLLRCNSIYTNCVLSGAGDLRVKREFGLSLSFVMCSTEVVQFHRLVHNVWWTWSKTLLIKSLTWLGNSLVTVRSSREDSMGIVLST